MDTIQTRVMDCDNYSSTTDLTTPLTHKRLIWCSPSTQSNATCCDRMSSLLLYHWSNHPSHARTTDLMQPIDTIKSNMQASKQTSSHFQVHTYLYQMSYMYMYVHGNHIYIRIYIYMCLYVCIYMCVYICIYIYICTCLYMYMYMQSKATSSKHTSSHFQVHLWICIYIRIYIYVWVYIYIYICIHTHTHIYTYVYMYIYICVYIHICMYMYIYIYKHVNIYLCMNRNISGRPGNGTRKKVRETFSFKGDLVFLCTRDWKYFYIYIYITYICISGDGIRGIHNIFAKRLGYLLRVVNKEITPTETWSLECQVSSHFRFIHNW